MATKKLDKEEFMRVIRTIKCRERDSADVDDSNTLIEFAVTLVSLAALGDEESMMMIQPYFGSGAIKVDGMFVELDLDLIRVHVITSPQFQSPTGGVSKFVN